MLEANFGFYMLVKAIFQCIDSDHCIIVSKALWFLYNNLAMLPDKIIAYIMNRIIGQYFIKLFCHWSATVRGVFHNFILYTVFNLYREILNTGKTLR